METRSRRRGEGWAADRQARDMTELAAAFRHFEGLVAGLSVDVVGHVSGSRTVHPIAGFHVRMPGPAGTGVSLYVSAQYGELVRWRPGSGALRERFDVTVDDVGYGWGGSLYGTAADLAHDLVAYMQFNLDAIGRQ
jgi:hypothetical protein